MTRRRIPLAGPDRRGWAAFAAGSLVALCVCSKSEEGTTSSNASAVASQAQAAQSAIASAQAAHDEDARGAMPMQGDAGRAPANVAFAGNAPPMKVGGPMDATGGKRRLGQSPAMNTAGGLPPAPGTPHLYHRGVEGFFLEQGSAIGLTREQQMKLTAIKGKADVAYAAAQRKLDQAENDLWTLTSVENPDATKIDAKVSEIGRLGAGQRMDYVRAIGSAVAVLTDAQRKAVMALDPASMPSASPSSPKGQMVTP